MIPTPAIAHRAIHHRWISLMVFVFFVSVSVAQMFAQACGPDPIFGNRMGNRLRITDPANACGCGNNYTLPYTLHLLESGAPSLRFSSNGPTTGEEICAGSFHATLSLFRGGAQYSTLEAVNDFSIVVDQSSTTTANLILSTRDAGSMIRFATTPPGGGSDVERMNIIDIGHVGIGCGNPKELLHIGAKMTFHVGSIEDYLGYNVYRDGTDTDRLIMDESGTPIGQALKFGATRYGIIEMGVGKTSSGALTDEVDWYEGTGRPYLLDGNTKSFAGLTIKEYGGKGCASFGRHVPDADSRVFIKSFSGPNACALKIVSSANAELLRVGNDGKVGIGTDAPKAVLHVNGDVVIGANKCTTTISSTLTNRLSVDGAICTKEIWVKLAPWADYVFDEDYELIALPELEKYITANKHLPEVPTAAEVEANGVSLGEMQVILLKKIEELTLHVIAIEKKNTALEARVQVLSASTSVSR